MTVTVDPTLPPGDGGGVELTVEDENGVELGHAGLQTDASRTVSDVDHPGHVFIKVTGDGRSQVYDLTLSLAPAP